MKWFKHDTDAAEDPKLKKLKKRFGLAGYGLYFNLLELIARNIDDHLDEVGFVPKDWDDEALEMEFGLSSDTLRPMLDFICEVGLFERKGGRLFNNKIEGRCDDYTARLLRNRGIVRTKSEHYTNNVLPDKIRVDKIREDKDTPTIVGPKKKL